MALGVAACGILCATAIRAETATPAPSTEPETRALFDVRSKMRDGVTLSSDVWMPAKDGKYPIILLRTPYTKTMEFLNTPELATYFAKHGYAFAVQDTRGRGDSEGKFDFFFQEAHDGYDTVEALAREPWSNGRVCMIGVSYLGTVQWLAAKERPPHLTCIAPTSPGGQYLNELPYAGGAFMVGWVLNFLNGVSGHLDQGPNAKLIDWPQVLAHRPLLTADEKLGRRMPLYRQFLEHPTLDAYWKRILLNKDDFRKIDIPVLTVTGWFDGDQAGTLHYWNGLQQAARKERNEYLVIGPWNHVESFIGGSPKMGEIELPPEAKIDNRALHLAFFDRYLKQQQTPFEQPRARLFITGANRWRNFDQYPVKADTQRLFFASGGKANTLNGDGRLVHEKQGDKQPTDNFTFDPKNPVILKLELGVFGGDRRETQKREDVLTYTTEPLAKPLQVIGPVAVELHATTDGRDTDFTAAINDVYPDGRAVLIGSKPIGILRARYREGLEKTVLLEPGKPALYRIDLGHIGHEFQPGHRIRVEISSSAAPLFNPNQNTGNPIATDTEWRVAKQQILHDAAHPSALVLPVVSD